MLTFYPSPGPQGTGSQEHVLRLARLEGHMDGGQWEVWVSRAMSPSTAPTGRVSFGVVLTHPPPPRPASISGRQGWTGRY